MNDPLSNFDWPSLYRLYDAKCKGYRSSSRCLDRFATDRPDSDRDLYYRLVECYAAPARMNDSDVIGTYTALLYWKLYSTGGSEGNNILDWLATGSKGRRAAESQLPPLLANLPPPLAKDAKVVVKLVRSLPQIPGMGSDTMPLRFF